MELLILWVMNYLHYWYTRSVLLFTDVLIYFLDIPGLQENLSHSTFLEELVFWTVKFEFPQKIVCLLLNMLPDQEYKVCIVILLLSTCGTLIA